MTDNKQAINKLIQEHERRLQKLKEKEARQGINTPVEILTEIEDIEEKLRALTQVKAQKIDDPYLSLIMAIAAIIIEPVGITLNINGSLVSGYIIGPDEYGDHWLDTIAEEGVNFGINPNVVEASRTTYIHLRDARFHPDSGDSIPPFHQPGIFWRGKLSALDGYALGRQTPNGWELPPHLMLKTAEDEAESFDE